jgi:hypothetical protein
VLEGHKARWVRFKSSPSCFVSLCSIWIKWKRGEEARKTSFSFPEPTHYGDPMSDVSPVLEHIIMPDATGANNMAEWGYQNRVGAARDVPVGTSPIPNYFTPNPQNQGQPTHFLSPAAGFGDRAGRVRNVFRTPLPNGNLVWHLYQSTATAGGKNLQPLVVTLLCSAFTLTQSDLGGGVANRVAKFLVTNPNSSTVVVPPGPNNELTLPRDINQNVNFLLRVQTRIQLPGGQLVAPDPILFPTAFAPGRNLVLTVRTDLTSGVPNDDMSGADLLGMTRWDLHGSTAESIPGGVLPVTGPFNLPCDPIV